MPRKTYADYNRPGEAETFEHQHFSGAFGSFLKASDENELLRLLSDRSASVLDVGAGSGRLSLFLAQHWSAPIVASDASTNMLRAAASRRVIEGQPALVLANALSLPFQDQSFDYVISFRTIMHFPEWKVAVAEMCRIARQAVVIDAPASFGAPGLEALYHRTLRFFGGRRRPYRTFNSREIAHAFQSCGFKVNEGSRNFVLPVKLCRAFGNSQLPQRVENLCRKTGISKIFGGQYIVRAVRI